MAVHHVPQGHNAVSPYLVTKNAEQVIGLMKRAFGGEELHRSTRPDGTIMHAEVRIGDSVVMIGEACSEFPTAPAALSTRAATSGGSPPTRRTSRTTRSSAA